MFYRKTNVSVQDNSNDVIRAMGGKVITIETPTDKVVVETSKALGVDSPMVTFKEGNDNQRTYLLIGTTDSEWGSVFVVKMQTKEDFDCNGADQEWGLCQSLKVGEKIPAYDYEGMYIMRVS